MPKERFLAQVERDAAAVSPFLLAAMLAMAARFSAPLHQKFTGNGHGAVPTFVRLAEAMAPSQLYQPTLPNVQAFMLLGAAEWAQGDCNRGLLHLGISSTMAGMLRLHREDTYALPPDAAPDDVVRAEEARRTLWMMGRMSPSR